METTSPLADKKARMRFNKALREKGVAAKACGKCFVVKGHAAFYANLSTADKRAVRCKPCDRSASQRWRKANPERESRVSRQWYARNREQQIEAALRWRKANPERFDELNRRWKADNPARAKAIKRHAGQLRRARVAAATIVPFTYDELLASWAEDDLYGCACCGGPFEEIEHIVPICRGGEHSIANLVPSCIECNRGVGGKGQRDPWEWLAERFPNLAPILLPDVVDAPAK